MRETENNRAAGADNVNRESGGSAVTTTEEALVRGADESAAAGPVAGVAIADGGNDHEDDGA